MIPLAVAKQLVLAGNEEHPTLRSRYSVTDAIEFKVSQRWFYMVYGDRLDSETQALLRTLGARTKVQKTDAIKTALEVFAEHYKTAVRW